MSAKLLGRFHRQPPVKLVNINNRVKEHKMGNPAGDRLKKRLKRRKRFEKRLAGLATAPKAVPTPEKKATK
jgi:hypothetical protein